MEHVLDRDAVGVMLGQQRGEAGVDDRKPLGECGVRRSGKGPEDDEAVPAAVAVDAAISGALGPGIDPENFHANEASISFSSISAFVQTFFVSSWSSRISISFSICCAA